VGLTDELERVAAAAAAHGEVTGVLAAEPSGRGRLYLVALDEGDERGWLAVDAAGEPVTERALVREVASIVVMCELAEEISGGGQLDELRARLATLRTTEDPDGIAAAEDAALALERAIGTPPRVASTAFLDDVGAATLALEQALQHSSGELESPFASALRSSTGAMDAFLAEVETRYVLPLS
jgi:hypothetical protein